MATGKQAGTALTATVWSIVYEIPAATVWTGKVNFANRGATTAKVRLAYGTGSSGSAGEYVEYDAPLAPAGNLGNVIERNGEVLQAGQRILAYSDSNDVDVVVQGYEE
jgi:hypothetical protein